jgi:outer membrane protein OmpA-like peptidoglycan-associated protein
MDLNRKDKRMKKSSILKVVLCAAVAMGLWGAGKMANAAEVGNEHPLNITFSVGRMDFEGDFPTDDGFVGTARLGYDYSRWWTFEAGVFLCPYLEGSHYTDWDNEKGQGFGADINRLEDEAGVSSTWALGITGDALFHFTPWKRVDPYLALGGIALTFGDDFEDNDQADLGLRGGGGVLFNINDAWALRADFRGSFAGVSEKGTVNSILDVGVRYVFGANVAPAYTVSGGPKDSDADGLTDEEELRIGTDPYHPDTDRDGLGDFDEVRTYTTDPLNPDTDFDGLKDGPEVFHYTTDPKDRDTDDGGVADGHEVMEDATDPRAGHGGDDLQLFELNIQFDYNQSVIKPEYFKDLDVIAKVLKRDPGASARIEGHADKLKDSKRDYNMVLSEKRANACLDYLATKGGIDRSLLKAVGYGFDRPKAANDKIKGNPVNRRVEVYIRKSGSAPAPVSPIKAVELPPATAPAK